MANLSFDGEIAPVDQAALQDHLDRCTGCRQNVQDSGRFQAKLRQELQRSSDSWRAPEALQHRITGRIRANCPKHRGYRAWVPVLVGVGTVLTVALISVQNPPLDPEETVAKHSRLLPPEVRAKGGHEEVRNFLKKNLQYPIRVPTFAPNKARDIRLVGARLSHIRNSDAAYMMYDQRGARISLFAYPKPPAFSKPRDFREEQVRGRPVMVGRHRGYSVVSWEQGELMYSLVSDVDRQELIQMVSSLK